MNEQLRALTVKLRRRDVALGWVADEIEEACDPVRKALQVAKETIDGWKIGDDGRVHVHKDVISKAVNAAIHELNRPLD